MKLLCSLISLALAIGLVRAGAFGAEFNGAGGYGGAGGFGGAGGYGGGGGYGGYGDEQTYMPRPDECEGRDIIELEAYIGWPVRISCAKLAYDYSDVAYNQFLFFTPPPEHHDTHCLIVDKDTNATIMDKDHRVWSWKWLGYRYPFHLMEDITAESSSRYMMQLKTLSTCTYEDLTLKIQESPNMTCQEAVVKEEHAIFRVDVESSEHLIDCEVNYYYGRMVTSLIPGVHDYNVTWYKDCEPIQPELSNGTYIQNQDTLTFGMVDYAMSGTYSCEISYKGNKRTGRIVDLCVRPPRNVQPPVISCPRVVRVKLNTTASVTCTVTLSYRPRKDQRPNVQWRQEIGKSHHVCIEYGYQPLRKHDQRSHCSTELRPSPECFSHVPTAEEQQSKILLTFSVDNLKRADVGEYSARFSIGKSIVSATWKLRVQRQPKEKTEKEKEEGKY